MNMQGIALSALLSLSLISLVACSPSDDLSGAAQSASEEAVEGPVAALEGFDGDLESWGQKEGKQIVAASGFSLFGVSKPAAILVLDTQATKDIDSVIEAYNASDAMAPAVTGTSIYYVEVFASEGGLGTTRFRLVGSATRVIPEK